MIFCIQCLKPSSTHAVQTSWCDSALSSLVAIRFDSSIAETRLWFGHRATVVPISQDFTKPRRINLVTPRRELNPQKYINIVYDLCFARQKHDVWIAVVPVSCSTVEHVELQLSPNLTHWKVKLRIRLLPCFCRTSFLNLVRTAEARPLNWTSEICMVKDGAVEWTNKEAPHNKKVTGFVHWNFL